MLAQHHATLKMSGSRSRRYREMRFKPQVTYYNMAKCVYKHGITKPLIVYDKDYKLEKKQPLCLLKCSYSFGASNRLNYVIYISFGTESNNDPNYIIIASQTTESPTSLSIFLYTVLSYISDSEIYLVLICNSANTCDVQL